MKIKKRFGVLGGMGPEATLLFYKYIINYTKAAKDQDHLESIIAMLPHIPDRTAAILNSGTNPSPYILEGLQILANAGVDFAVITCNTAHYFLKDIEKELPIPILNMIELVTDKVKKRQISRIGLLATSGTLETQLYDEYFKDVDLAIVKPSSKYQKRIMDLIYGNDGIKAGHINKINHDKLVSCVNHLKEMGAENVILGCTELPLVLGRNLDESIIDPFSLLALETIKIIKGG